MAKDKPGSRTKGSRKVQQRLANLLVETDDSIKARDLGIKDADELEVRGTGKSKKPWTVKNCVYYLKIDTPANRKALRKHLSAIVKKDGNTDAIKGIGGLSSATETLSVVRVVDIILDETHPEFINLGGWEESMANIHVN